MNDEIRLALLRTLPFLIVIIIIAILTKRKKVKLQDLDMRKPFSFKLFLIWTLGFLLYSLFIEFQLASFSILEVNTWRHTRSGSIILISGIVIFAPIAEELLFRGLILNVLIKKRINAHLAILIQACFFVMLHNFTYEFTLASNIGIAQSFIDATLFGYARRATQSLYTPITMHMTGNAVAIIERFIL